jgi:hypothetical protein
MQNTVGINIESNFDLRNATRRRRYTIEVETPDGFISDAMGRSP